MARTGRIIPSVSAAQKWIFYVSSSLQMSPSLTGIQPEKKNDTDFNNWVDKGKGSKPDPFAPMRRHLDPGFKCSEKSVMNGDWPGYANCKPVTCTLSSSTKTSFAAASLPMAFFNASSSSLCYVLAKLLIFYGRTPFVLQENHKASLLSLLRSKFFFFSSFCMAKLSVSFWWVSRVWWFKGRKEGRKGRVAADATELYLPP